MGRIDPCLEDASYGCSLLLGRYSIIELLEILILMILVILFFVCLCTGFATPSCSTQRE